MTNQVPITQHLERWWHILASHRPSQLGWRAFSHVQRRLFPLLPGSAYSVPSDHEFRVRASSGMAKVRERQLALRVASGELSDRVEQLLAGEFSFLNERRPLGPAAAVDLSRVTAVSHLWRFHLHYQEYLLDLLAAADAGRQEAGERIWPVIDTWIQNHPLTRPGAISAAWHPFCLSRRIAVWLILDDAGVIPSESQQRFRCSLESQTRFLERHLEWDLRGNHLFENLRALVLAGACWDGAEADRRLDIAIRHLDAQLTDQILPTGEHFERSPMYHAQMLSAVLDIRDVTTNTRPEFSSRCRDGSERMAAHLRRLLHPDGHIPLLSDSTRHETPAPELLLDASCVGREDATAAAGPRESEAGSDYWIWRDGGDFLILDHGPVAADELPAHGHCDLLTIEASVGGQRLIVDGGVYDYGLSEMREYCRSTAAHNVLQVDGIDQCDVWSRFRMGRRGRPTGSRSGQDGDFRWAAAIHDAYNRQGVPVVGRWIGCRPGGPWIIADWVTAQGTHDLADRLHLSPEATVQLAGDGRADVMLGDRTVFIECLTGGSLSVTSGWYCPDFGVRHRAPVMECTHRSVGPAMIVWVISWQAGSGNVIVGSGISGEQTVEWHDGDTHHEWSPMLLFDPPAG